jgi:thioredoxin 1
MNQNILRATEATFTRQVVRAPLPVIVCLGAQRCPGRRAMTPSLERIAARYTDTIRAVLVTIDHAPLLVEQYGIHASPSVLVFQDGERQSQVIGFLADGLVELLADDVAQGLVSGDGFWSPVEARLEDVVLIPLFAQWGWAVQRQTPCALGANQRGRIDLLVFDHPDAPPITLVESKRAIRSAYELQQAVAQAQAYAHSLGLPSFLIADPQGIRVYRCDGAQAVCVRRFTSLGVHHAPASLRQAILSVRG